MRDNTQLEANVITNITELTMEASFKESFW